jgi:hypothetical protein
MPGAIVAIIAGVREPIDIEFVTVGYPAEKPLGVRQLIGTAAVPVPTIGTTATTFVQGVLLFPVTEPSTAEVRIYGNGELLGSRPVIILPPPVAPGGPG